MVNEGHESILGAGVMTIAIIIASWFALSVIAAPLIGRLLSTVGKDEATAMRPEQRKRKRHTLGNSGKSLAPQHHRSEFPQPIRRAARSRM